MRLCVGVCQSQIYAQLISMSGQPDLRRPGRADGYDVWHAILASTTEVFLTLDRRLADHVERVPDIGVRVARSVGDLLAMLEELPGSAARSCSPALSPAAVPLPDDPRGLDGLGDDLRRCPLTTCSGPRQLAPIRAKPRKMTYN